MEIDIEIIFKIASIGILITVCTQILKKGDRDDFALFVGIIGVILVFSIIISLISDLFTNIKNIFLL